MHHRLLLLAAGALTTAVVLGGHKRRVRKSKSRAAASPGTSGSKAQKQLVHAYPAGAYAESCSSAEQQQLEPKPCTSGSSVRGVPSRSYAVSSTLLLVSLLVALCVLGVLVWRGQADLAAAVAVAWLLAAPAILALGNQQAASALASASDKALTGNDAGAGAPDAVMLVEDEEPPLHTIAHFHGTWIKDAAASESMDAAMRLVHLNAVMRQAVKLIRGVQLRIEPQRLHFAVFSAISWFKLGEEYPWGQGMGSGEVHENRRRDMRRGRSRGSVQVTPQGTIKLHYEWDNPHAGRATDEFSLDDQGRLRLHTVVVVGSQTTSYVQVYRRKKQRQQQQQGQLVPALSHVSSVAS